MVALFTKLNLVLKTDFFKTNAKNVSRFAAPSVFFVQLYGKDQMWRLYLFGAKRSGDKHYVRRIWVLANIESDYFEPRK